MFEKSAAARHRNAARVIVRLAGEPPFEAFVFLKVDERLIDLFNDARQFIPIKRADGSTLIAAKRNIVSVIESEEPPFVEPEPAGDAAADAASADGAKSKSADGDDARRDEAETDGPAAEDPQPARRRFDPYEVLRVSPTATIDEIRRAYHQRIKAVHPDSLANLGLDQDIERAAHHAAQRVNRAYNALMRERRTTANGAG